MNKITINTLMPSSNQSYLHKGKIDINSISKDKFINDDPDINFDSGVLLKSIQKKREKIRSKLVSSYKNKRRGLDTVFYRTISSSLIDVISLLGRAAYATHIAAIR